MAEKSRTDGPVARNWDGLSMSDIDKALSRINKNIQEWEREVEVLDQRLVAAHKEKHLLEQIVALREEQVSGRAPSGTARANLGKGTQSHPVVEEAINQIREAGRALHINELHEAVSRRTTIPGAGKQANLISYLSRDDRIARPARGLYGLKELGHVDGGRRKSAARRKVRRRAKSSASK